MRQKGAGNSQRITEGGSMMSEITTKAGYIIDAINKITLKTPGKKTLQKMVYLIQEKGLDLGYEYGLYFYGPYSAELDKETMFLSSDGVIEFTYSEYSHMMEIGKDVTIKSGLSQSDEDAAKEVIEHFKDYTPSKLELLTTAIYAYNNLEQKTEKDIINGVKKIKGEKYSDSEIKDAIAKFSYFGKKPTPGM
jgi:uncharacterized protein YwgA